MSERNIFRGNTVTHVEGYGFEVNEAREGMRNVEERTAPTAYGKIDLVCEECMQTTNHHLEVGPSGKATWNLPCAHCGHVQVFRVVVSAGVSTSKEV